MQRLRRYANLRSRLILIRPRRPRGCRNWQTQTACWIFCGSAVPPRHLLKRPKGSAKGNGPVAGGTKPSAPVEASFVGAKVCVTCHATQADSFSHTLMGRIGKTQKGKFDCENCHGPGSAHVKAGGGRGVGGIISFRPEDQSRTAEENNAICLTCHQRGDRTNWSGSTHDTRGLMCTNCHTVMKQVSRKFQIKDGLRARHLLPVPQGPARADVPLVTHADCAKARWSARTATIRMAVSTEALLQERFNQRYLLQVPRGKARTVPVRAHAGTRELPELSRSARLGERIFAEDVASAAVHRVSPVRSRHDQRTAGGPVDEPSVPELPYRSSRYQQPVRTAAPSVMDVERSLAEDPIARGGE